MGKYIIIGLGNPGSKYNNTRHNVGFSVLDVLINRYFLESRMKKNYSVSVLYLDNSKFVFIKPLTYMNLSGEVIPNLDLQKYKKVLVICDNLDLNVGQTKIKLNSSSAGQKGLKSIMEYTDSFIRVFIGIGRGILQEDKEKDISEFVLSSHYDLKEKEKLNGAINKTADMILSLKDNEIESLMNEYNRRSKELL